MANKFEFLSKYGNITPEKAHKSRQNSVCLGSLPSMRSLVIDEHCLSVRALYATLLICNVFHRPQGQGCSGHVSMLEWLPQKNWDGQNAKWQQKTPDKMPNDNKKVRTKCQQIIWYFVLPSDMEFVTSGTCVKCFLGSGIILKN